VFLSSAIAAANEIYSISLVMDGSFEPPGDEINATVILVPGVRDAHIDVGAFLMPAKDGADVQTPISTKSEKNRDDAGKFRKRVPLITGGMPIEWKRLNDLPDVQGVERITFDRKIQVPYRDLDIPKGTHFLFYELRLVAGGHVEETAPTELSYVTVTDNVRKEM